MNGGNMRLWVAFPPLRPHELPAFQADPSNRGEQAAVIRVLLTDVAPGHPRSAFGVGAVLKFDPHKLCLHKERE